MLVYFIAYGIADAQNKRIIKSAAFKSVPERARREKSEGGKFAEMCDFSQYIVGYKFADICDYHREQIFAYFR